MTLKLGLSITIVRTNLCCSGGDAARSKFGGRMIPPSSLGGAGGSGGQRSSNFGGGAEELRPTDSSGQRAYFPLALQVRTVCECVFMV